MDTRDIVILFAGALVVVAALAVATTGDVLETQSTDDEGPWSEDASAAKVTRCGATAPPPAFPGGTEVETWQEPVPDGTEGGDLDLQSYRGGVVVLPWDRDEVEVQVALDDPDDELEPHVEVSTDGGVLDVTVHVRERMAVQEGPVYASPDRADDARGHILLRVPELTYGTVDLRDRPGGGDQVAVRPPSSGSDDGGDSQSFPTRVGRLDATRLGVDVVNGGVQIALVTVAEDVTVDTVNGGVCVAHVRSSSLATHTTNGGIGLFLHPASDGEVTASTTNGGIQVLVATGERFGYDVQADTTNGGITIELPNADVDRSDDPGHTSAHARTRGYEDRPVQVQMDLDTTNGGIGVAGLGS